MADQIISAVAPNIFERCVGAAGEHLGYIWNYKSNMAKLETQVNKLDEERADKTHAITIAENNAHKIKDRVKSWQGKADKISKEATQILKDHQDKGKKRCLLGLCPNLVSRYQFSKRVCKEQREIDEAVTEAQKIREVSDPAVGHEKTILSTEGCFTFDSRKSLLEDIIKELQGETKNLVGVYGLGGMGKTTLVKQVASQATKETIFEEVVMASVTQKVDMKEIQGQIASMLGLKLEESTIAERASRIHERLKGKKILVILDDLWKKLDFKDVGIPFGTEHMGCKILLTSRSLQVLSSMGTKIEFLIGALKEEEAWGLFEQKTTDVVKNPAFLTVGKKITKRCAGLPVLIVTVAASLSRRPQLHAWNDALKQLKKMNNKEMYDIVNSAIESITYNHLEKTHKRLFVLCGVIGGDASIETVLQYGMGWDMFDGDVVTIQGARERLHSLILDLKDHCLLLDDHSRNYISMHDVVRDIAISIGKKDLGMFSIGDNDAQLNTWPMDDVLKSCTSIVLRGCPNVFCLPQQLGCPKVEMCILNNSIPFSSNSSLTIPNTFFEKTGKLKVLDMSGLDFSVLPSSLSFLKYLQALCLDDCDNLKDISGVGELKKLQTLSIVGSDIEELPSGIGELSELRLLDMRQCYLLKVIPAGLIKGLSQLEELYVSRDFVKWEAGECISGCVRNNASLVELKHLPNLCTLEIAVEDAKLLPEDLKFEKFERYEITVGEMWDYDSCWEWLDQLEITRKICLQVGSTSINHWEHGVKKLFKGTESLYLGEVEGIKNISPELDENGFPDLKHLCIKKDYEMQYIVTVEDGKHQVSFPSLESLRLNHLLKLQKICNGRLMKESFNKLTFMEVGNCNKLKSLFTFSVATELRCIEEIRVSACDALEGIVGENKEDDGIREMIEFGQLRKLSLTSLPTLKSFTSILPASQKSSTSDEESEKELQSCVPFFEKVFFPKLEELELSDISNFTEMWSHKHGETSCCNLTRLSIQKCDSLKYLLTPSICRGLALLRRLTIGGCVKMRSVVAKEKGETKIEEISFPKLSYLCLGSLVNLTTFYEEMDSNDDSDIAIKPLFNEKVSFPKLEGLEIVECERLKYLLTPSAAMTLVGLKILTVQNCANMEHIVAKEEGETNMEMISFPHLTNLCLENLPDLATFYTGSIKEKDSNGNLDTAMQPLFNEMIQFPMLKQLDIYQLESINILWQNQQLYRVNSFCKQEEVRIVSCASLVRTGFPDLKHLCIKNDFGMQYIVNVEDGQHQVSFPSLESLRLCHLLKLQKICNGRLMKESFHNLAILEVTKCNELKSLFSFSIATKLLCLEEIRVSECNALEGIVGERKEDGGVCEKIEFSRLRKLSLRSLPKLKNFISILPASHRSSTSDEGSEEELQSCVPLFDKVSFPKLEKLEIVECDRLKSLLTPSVAIALVGLQSLTVQNCARMAHVVAKEEETNIEMISFPQLTHLYLENLPDLATIYVNENLDTAMQPLFNEKIQFPMLKQLEIYQLESINILWQNPQLYHVNSFCKLEEVRIVSCASLVQNGFPDLKHLCIKNDYEMQYIVNVKDGHHQVSFPSLESLELSHLLRLQKICNGRLMKESFNSLTFMEVGNCNELKSLFSFSMAIELRCLEEIRVSECSALEGIVREKKEDDGVFEKIEFGQLRKLSLRSLPKLKNFISILPASHKSSTSDEELHSCVPFFEKVSFPKLEELEIVECDRLKSLLTPSVSITLVGLQSLTIQNCARMDHVVAKEEGETNIEMISFPQLTHLYLWNLPHLATFYARSKDSNDSVMQPLFNKKIQFPMLKQLEIYLLESISILWQNLQLYHVNSFCKLEHVTIQSCASLVKMFSSTMSTMHVEDPQESLGFQNLKMVSLHQCNSLKHVFLVSVAHCLNKLEVVRIVCCEALETIVGDESYEESSQQVAFLFPTLARLELMALPKLECLYPRKHTTKCPALKELEVVDCGKVYAMDFLSFPENKFEKVIPGLKDLSIRSMDMMRLYDHFPPHLFQSLQELTITEFHGESAIFPTKFLSTIHNKLNTLRVVNCSFQEVFPYEGEVIRHANDDVFFPQLRTLQLDKLPELKSICKQEMCSPFVPDILDKIVHLYVLKCPRLTRVVSPSVSFGLLGFLTISNCSGLINVIQLSTARSLKQLSMLTIMECEMIEEIIEGKVGDYGEEEIIFSKLGCIELDKLPRLTTFCPSRDYTFNFPQLASVTVIECPNLKTFSGGITTAPHLEEVYLGRLWEDPTTCWENDLNTTVERIYTEMEAKRLATALLSSNHVEAQAQIRESFFEELMSEPRMECQNGSNLGKESESRKGTETCKEVAEGQTKDSENCEKLVKVVDDIRDKGKGKELQVSRETPLAEQAVAISQLDLASSSRSRSTPPTINPSNQVSHCATQVQVQRLPATVPITIADSMASLEISLSPVTQVDTTLPPTSSSSHFEAEAQTHANSARMGSWDAINQEQNVAEYRAKQTIEDHNKKEEVVNTCEKGKEKEVEVSLVPLCVMEHSDKSKYTSCPSDPTFSNYAAREQTIAACLASSEHAAASSSQLSPPFINLSDGVRASSLATQVEAQTQSVTVSATSSNNQFEGEAQFHDKSPKKSTDEPRKEGQICRNGIEELRREVGTSSDASNSQRKDSEESHVVKDFTPSLSEFLQILQTQPPVESISAEQVQFMEHAMEWFGPYLQKSRECIERNKAISELKVEIAEMEVRMQAMKEKQKALEDENKATTCSVLRFR